MMKSSRAMAMFLALAAGLLLGGLTVDAQNIYTRKVRLADFPTRTTKVANVGYSMLGQAFQDEVTTHWNISPYEFCTEDEFEKFKQDPSVYLLSLTYREGIMFLTLSKGGKEDAADQRNRPFEVVSVPVASANDPDGDEIVYMGAYIDMVQSFVEDAMISDSAAYGGLNANNARKARKRDNLVSVRIAPADESEGRFAYEMSFDPDTHELLVYKKTRFRNGDRTR